MRIKVRVEDGKVQVNMEGFQGESCGPYANNLLKKLKEEIDFDANVRAKRDGEDTGVML